ncbi:MAG: hypothetical protein Q9190_000925 [Brigantiaea leucoxantha]
MEVEHLCSRLMEAATATLMAAAASWGYLKSRLPDGEYFAPHQQKPFPMPTRTMPGLAFENMDAPQKSPFEVLMVTGSLINTDNILVIFLAIFLTVITATTYLVYTSNLFVEKLPENLHRPTFKSVFANKLMSSARKVMLIRIQTQLKDTQRQLSQKLADIASMQITDDVPYLKQSIDQKGNVIDWQSKLLSQKDKDIAELRELVRDKSSIVDQQKDSIKRQVTELADLQEQLNQRTNETVQHGDLIKHQDEKLADLENQINHEAKAADQQADLNRQQDKIISDFIELTKHNDEVIEQQDQIRVSLEEQIELNAKVVDQKDKAISQQGAVITALKSQIEHCFEMIEQRGQSLEDKDKSIAKLGEQIKRQDKAIDVQNAIMKRQDEMLADNIKTVNQARVMIEKLQSSRPNQDTLPPLKTSTTDEVSGQGQTPASVIDNDKKVLMDVGPQDKSFSKEEGASKDEGRSEVEDEMKDVVSKEGDETKDSIAMEEDDELQASAPATEESTAITRKSNRRGARRGKKAKKGAKTSVENASSVEPAKETSPALPADQPSAEVLEAQSPVELRTEEAPSPSTEPHPAQPLPDHHAENDEHPTHDELASQEEGEGDTVSQRKKRRRRQKPKSKRYVNPIESAERSLAVIASWSPEEASKQEVIKEEQQQQQQQESAPTANDNNDSGPTWIEKGKWPT